MYNKPEVYKHTLKYFNNDELATNVWIDKYALRNDKGEFLELTPSDMHWRIANEIARIEQKYPNPLNAQTIFNLLHKFKYIIPQGSAMYGIGNNKPVSLSNCFVIGNQYDSYSGILTIDQEQIQLMKRRGGVGHDLSHIRPKGSIVQNSALTSTGAVSFMERYSNSTREVAQDGRRGALMLSMSIKHPDIIDFIDAKIDLSKITGANISIRITNDFMKAVANDDDYILQFPIEGIAQITKTVKAKELWNKIVHNAWQSAEPGILFWDTILQESVADCYSSHEFTTTSTNPCGEIPLCPYDSCRLLALNLYSYVTNPFTPNVYFDLQLFKQHVEYAQRIMDDIVDLEIEKIEQIINKIENDPESNDLKRIEYELWKKILSKTVKGRRIGIGITGEADMLAALGYKYSSSDATSFAVKIQKTLAIEAYKASNKLGYERGNFPIYNHELEKDNPFIKRLYTNIYSRINSIQIPRRNISLLTIAPTGTVSLMTQTSSGIEPVFMIYHKRKRKINPVNISNVTTTFTDEYGDTWEEYNVIHKPFNDWYITTQHSSIPLEKFTKQELDKLISISPYANATAMEIDPINKIKMQALMQKWIDHSISNTINVPSDITESEISDLFKTAWSHGCKGITIYREGSRNGILSNDKQSTIIQKRPKTVDCKVHNVVLDGTHWTVLVGAIDNKPYEIFALENNGISIKNVHGTLIKENGKYSFRSDVIDIDDIVSHYKTGEEEFTTRMISRLLRTGTPIDAILSDAHKTRTSITAFSQGIARVLSKYTLQQTNLICPECGQDTYTIQEGCEICTSCGYSKCG